MKMKKLVALVTAAALCLGMSMTVFAEGSDDPSDVPTNGGFDEAYTNPGVDQATGLVKDGFHAYDMDYALAKGWITQKDYDTAMKAFKDPDKLLDIIGEEFKVPKGAEAKVVAVADLQFKKWVDGKYELITDPKDFPEEGITQDVYVGDAKAKGLKEGDKIYVTHYKKDGSWEVIEGTVKTVNGSAYVNVHFDSLSPVAFVKVMSNGKVIALDKKGEPVKSGKSPKTGEF